MTSDNRKIFKLYENVANLGPAAETPVGPSNQQQVLLNIPSGFATGAKSKQEEEEDFTSDRKNMLASNLISIHTGIKSVAEDFKKMKDVPPWVQEKVAIASQYIEDVSQYYNGRTVD